MMQGKTSLNAYAAPYVPISKKSDGNNKAAAKVVGVSEKTEDVGEAVGCQLPDDISIPHISDKSYSDRSPIQEDTFAAVNQSMTDDRQMTIDYLMIDFSGYSEQSIAALLDFCNGDVFATLDMLDQFENEDAEIPGTSQVQHGEGSA